MNSSIIQMVMVSLPVFDSNSSIRVDAGKHVRDGGAQQSITVRNVLIHPSYIRYGVII